MISLSQHIDESIDKTYASQLTSLNDYDTFIIVKPTFARYTKQIIAMFEHDGYRVVRDSGQVTRPIRVYREMYAMHRGKKFYDDLCRYMSHGEVQAFLLKSPETSARRAIEHTNKLKDEIRSSWSRDDMHNVMHSSDSIDNVYRESNIFFNMQ